MLDGYGDICTEPSTHLFQGHQDGYDRCPLIEYDPILPELGPVEQGTKDAYDGTPDYTRASGDPVYRVTLIRTLLLLSAPARPTGQMTNVTGMTFDEAWAESGAPDNAGEEW